MSRHRCLILGAGGLVGQRLQQRLSNHPLFEIVAIAGSPSNSGEQLDGIPWRLEEERPLLPNLTILDANDPVLPELCQELEINVVFSGLPSNVAISVEPRLVNAGITVFSNASSFRRKPGVPLIIPEINSQHIKPSLHYCATNCTLVPLAIPLQVIHEISQIVSVKMRSEQALSGAGWELLHDADALCGQLNSHIEGEAEKISAELLYIMGTLEKGIIESADFETDIECSRISRKDGHQVFVEVIVESPIDRDNLLQSFDKLSVKKPYINLPSSPEKPLHVVTSIDSNLHLWSDGISFETLPNPADNLKTGMAVVVGDVSIESNRISFSAYSHNTIKGAAGGLVYLAECIMDHGH